LVGKQRRYKNIQPRQHHLAKSIFLVSGGGKSIKCSKQIKITKYKCGGAKESESHVYAAGKNMAPCGAGRKFEVIA